MKFCWLLLVLGFAMLTLTSEVEGGILKSISRAFTKARPPPKNGPSGKPMRHFPQHNSRKQAKDAAQREGGKNKPAHDTAHKPGQPNHYHSVGRDGKRIDNGVHHTYGKGDVRAGRKQN